MTTRYGVGVEHLRHKRSAEDLAKDCKTRQEATNRKAEGNCLGFFYAAAVSRIWIIQ